MFAIDETGALRRMKRRPTDWDARELRGWRFLPERRAWTVDERGAVIAAIDELNGLPGLGGCTDAWLKRRAAECCAGRPITLTADPD